MTAMALPSRDAQKLARILGMLGSAHSGERDAAALAAHKLIFERGLTWPTILGVEGAVDTADLSIAEMISGVRMHIAELTAKEARFITDISLYPSSGRALSVKQENWLKAIYARMAQGGHP
jgi:hypothetical protein